MQSITVDEMGQKQADCARNRARQLPPGVTVTRGAKALGVPQPTARQIVAQLEKQGGLEEITRRAWGRFYLVPRVVPA